MSKFDQVLPDELLWLIVEHVDDSPTLFALLTTCKSVFRPAVKKLWTDPFGFPFKNYENLKSLLKYVIDISPSRHPSVERIWEHFESSSLPTQEPFVDYLAMIHHVRFKSHRSWKSFPADLAYALLWVVCDGQFEQLFTITTVPGKIEEFLEMVPKMRRLTKVIWIPDDLRLVSELPKIRQFVEAFVAEHGDLGRQLEMDLEPVADFSFEKNELPELESAVIDLYRLLAPFPPSKRSILSVYDWAQCVAHKDSTDFSRIREVAFRLPKEVANILPRCRVLETLMLYFLVDVDIHLGPFLDPRPLPHGQTYDFETRPLPVSPLVSSPMFPMPPLREVVLTVRWFEFTQVMDGFFKNFEMTLEDINLTLSCEIMGPFGEDDYDRDSYLIFGSTTAIKVHTERWNFPRLRSLHLSTSFGRRRSVCFFVYGDMSKMSKLETLSLSEGPPGLFSDIDWEGYRMSPEVDDWRKECLPWKLPKLRELTLCHSAAFQFHPGSLAWSPKLKCLELTMDSRFKELDPDYEMQSAWLDVVESWSGPPLAQLSYLTLGGHAMQCLDIHATARLMPEVKQLYLEFEQNDPGMKNRPKLKEAILAECNAQRLEKKGVARSMALASTCLPNLRLLRLQGYMVAYEEDFDSLLQKNLFPGLQRLIIDCLDASLGAKVLETAKKHPSRPRVVVHNLN